MSGRPCPHGVPDGEDCMLCCREDENKSESCSHSAAKALGEKGCRQCGKRLADSSLGKAAP